MTKERLFIENKVYTYNNQGWIKKTPEVVYEGLLLDQKSEIELKLNHIKTTDR